MNAQGRDGAILPRSLAEAGGHVSVAHDLPVIMCQVRWPGEVDCGEVARVVLIVGCPGRRHVPAVGACMTCCCEVQRLEECPECGEAGPMFTVTAIGGQQ